VSTVSTGYTQPQLDQLWQEMDGTLPPLPTSADKSSAPRVAAMRCAGTELGAIFNIGFKTGTSLVIFFNCVVAKEFAAAINAAGQAYGWQKRGMVPAPSAHLAYPEPDDLATAIKVTSLSTYGMPSGVLANFHMPEYGDAGATLVFFFPRPAAMELLTYIYQAGELGKWWDRDFELIPRGN
jgi:hypothetical protein